METGSLIYHGLPAAIAPPTAPMPPSHPNHKLGTSPRKLASAEHGPVSGRTFECLSVNTRARACSRVFVPLCAHVGSAWHVRGWVFVRVCARLRVRVPARERLLARMSVGKGLRAQTTAQRLGSDLQHCSARPCHICAGTRLPPATSAPVLGSSQGSLSRT